MWRRGKKRRKGDIKQMVEKKEGSEERKTKRGEKGTSDLLIDSDDNDE